MEQKLGSKIRKIRKEKKITLADVSKETELSVGFLSNLENNQTSPTIAQLHKLCNVYGITLNDIIDLEEKEEETQNCNGRVSVVRANERRCLFQQEDNSLRYEAMTNGRTDIKTTAMIIDGEQLFSFTPHDHSELGIVIQGELELHVENAIYHLYPGDSIYIEAGTMHRARRLTPESCISYWCKVSPTIIMPMENTVYPK